MSTGRSRSEGWKHAKRDGHANEERLTAKILKDPSFATSLSRRLAGRTLGGAVSVRSDGSRASHVADIHGGRSPGKVDLEVNWGSGQSYRISVKKSDGGQAFLTSVDRFFKGMKAQFGVDAPSAAVKAMDLFIGGIAVEVLGSRRSASSARPRQSSVRSLEMHQHRLVATSIIDLYPEGWTSLISWFRVNISAVAQLVFSRGYAASSIDWASHLWYYNEQETPRRDQLFAIDDVAAMTQSHSNEIKPGPKNGGSTLQLPFGFLQMHSPQGTNQIQFHHSLEKISRSASSTST